MRHLALTGKILLDDQGRFVGRRGIVSDVTDKVDTVTLYVGPQRQVGLFEQIIALRPRRVIFNPGTENPGEYEQLRAAGIEPIEACTLVMLRTNQF